MVRGITLRVSLEVTVPRLFTYMRFDSAGTPRGLLVVHHRRTGQEAQCGTQSRSQCATIVICV